MALFLLSLSVVLIALFFFWQESLNSKSNRANAENPWFVFGVSYPGALSAWFRLKFPHLTCGSLASSAVVLAVYNYTEFDKQVKDYGFFFSMCRSKTLIFFLGIIIFYRIYIYKRDSAYTRCIHK